VCFPAHLNVLPIQVCPATLSDATGGQGRGGTFPVVLQCTFWMRGFLACAIAMVLMGPAVHMYSVDDHHSPMLQEAGVADFTLYLLQHQW
jgi:hypothetical protein